MKYSRPFLPKRISGRSKSPRSRRLTIETLEPRQVLSAGPLLISEFMAINDNGPNPRGLPDADNEYSDWIEIYNPTSESVDLDGWHLTDNAGNMNKWRFPDVTIDPGEYRLVRASGRDRTDPAAELHTDFQLENSGEYLALVQPDGEISHEYAPQYPPQFELVSFGLVQDVITVLHEGAEVSYLVPEASDAGLGTDWTAADFDDSTWTTHLLSNPIKISEVGIGSPDWVEIQNVSTYDVVTEGWVVAVNDGTDLQINDTYNTTWHLPETIAVGETIHATDTDRENSEFGANIWWRSTESGWVMIVDGDGQVVDFVVWGYTQAEIDTLSIQVGTHTVSVSDAWSGGPLSGNTQQLVYATRTGNVDHDGPADFEFLDANTMGTANPGLQLPFAADGIGPAPQTGLGFGSDPDIFEAVIRTNLAGEMVGQNTSLWTRISFDVESTDGMSGMQLRMKYEDGFVAYLNGQEVARRRAPASLSWNSAATSNRPSSMAANYETIPISDHLGLLREGENILAIHGLNDSVSSGEFLIVPELDLIAGGYATAYMFDATPGSANADGIAGRGPMIVDVTENPPQPTDGDDIPITAEVTETYGPIDLVQLYYRVMFDSESVLTMVDDGTSGDATAGDGIYTAVIPASVSAPGQMVRWRVTADDADGNGTVAPAFLDSSDKNQSPEYFGTMIADPAVTSLMPIFNWFARSPGSGHTRTGTRAAVFYDGLFYDNMFVRQRGGYTNNYSQKFDFNKGHDFYVNEKVGYVGEININAQGSDPAYVRQALAFQTFQAVDAEASESFNMRMEVNGNLDRVGIFIEQVDEDFLERYGFDPEGALYKFVQRGNLNPVFYDTTTGIEKKTRLGDDWSDIQSLVTGLKLTNDEARRRFLFDNINLPQVINYLAVRPVILEADDTRKNFYMYTDTNGNGEWAIFPWDKDWTFGVAGDGGPHLTHPFFGDQAHLKPNANQWNMLLEAIFNDPTTREMFLRRLRTVMDATLQEPGTPARELLFEPRVNEMLSEVRRHVSVSSSAITSLRGYFAPRREQLYEYHSIDNWTPGSDIAGIPHAQVGNPTITFGAFEYNPASGNQDQEYIELVNANDVAVDISGWKLRGGVKHTFQPGTVIPANSSLYVTPDSRAFRARTVGPRGRQGLLVQDRYKGHLSSFGETVTLLGGDEALVDTFTYVGEPSEAQKFLRISEVMYHPPEPTDLEFAAGFASHDDFEYVELINVGLEPLDLAGVHFTDGFQFTFGDVQLQPGERTLVVRKQAAFEARYGTGLNVAGEYLTRKLDDGGESIKLEDATNSTILDFNYDDDRPWPGVADGDGASLVVIDTAGDYDSWTNWRAGSEYLGSPGVAAVEPFADVVINEVLSKSNPPDVDWFELYNTTDTAIDLGGWYLSDTGDDLKKYRIADGTILAAGAYLVLDENDFNPPPYTTDFALNSTHGDDVWLLQADSAGNLLRFADHVEFGASVDGESFGRWPNGDGLLYPNRSPSPGQANNGPRVGPIVISELMYHPLGPGDPADPDDFEFVEIHNPTGTAVDLTDWQLADGVRFDFSIGSELAAGATLLVASFDPAVDTAELAAFREHYGLDASVEIVGPFKGKLENAGERVQLLRPGVPALDEPDYIPGLLEDEVRYDDVEPWPAEADGTGSSLTRAGARRWGNDPASWSAADATPGSVEFVLVDDAYEANNTPAEAHDLRPANGMWLSTLAGEGVQIDDDWYQIEVAAAQRHLVVDLTFGHGAGNIDLAIADSSATVHVAAKSSSDNEQIDTILSAGIWFLKIYGDDSGNTYDLRWKTEYVHPGDADLSGATDLSDFNIWNARKFTAGTSWQQGDFNGDGNTDLSDFNIWNAYKFTSAPAPTPVDAVLANLSDARRPDETIRLDSLSWLFEMSQRDANFSRPDPADRLASITDQALAMYWQ